VKHPLALAGIAAGLVGIVVYVCTALKRGKKPELAPALHVLGSAVGVAGGVRMFGIVIADELADQADSFQLLGEDALVICVGALALIWISIEMIVKTFKEL